MSFSFLLASPDAAIKQIARVRNYTDDIGDGTEGGGVEGVDYFLSNERITSFLEDVTDDALTATTAVNRAKLAASSALKVLAVNQAYVLKKGSTLGEDFDGPAVAKEIAARAAELRKEVEASEKAIAAKAAADAVDEAYAESDGVVSSSSVEVDVRY